MARHLRVEYPGAIYHVTCRIVGSVTEAGGDIMERHSEKCLFRDDADRERFLVKLSERVEQFNIRLYLFVLMANHFHLVFETPEANCSKFMQSLLTAYTVYYNLRHRRHGHLLDGRFKSKLVDGDSYLLALSRYVHLNPVQIASMKHKVIEERIKVLRAWPWSSYPSYIGVCTPLSFLSRGPLLAEMGGPRRAWPRLYREFVEGGLVESDDELKTMLTLSPRSIGSDEFRSQIDELYQERLKTFARSEDVSFRHLTEPMPPEDVMKVLVEVFAVELEDFKRRKRNCPLRAVAARMLIRYAALDQREVATLLNIGSGSAVCKQLSYLPDKLSKDAQLWRRVELIEKHLSETKSTRIRELSGEPVKS